MTDPQTPATEAGRRAQQARDYLSDQFYHMVFSDGSAGGDYIEDIDILAIEAEAIVLGAQIGFTNTEMAAMFQEGRADALREVERLAALADELDSGYVSRSEASDLIRRMVSRLTAEAER